MSADHATSSHDPTQHAQTEQLVLCLSQPGGDCHCTVTRCMCLLSTPRGLSTLRESPEPSPLSSPTHMIHPHFAVFTHASLPRQSGMAFHSGRCILHPDVTTQAAMPFGGRMSFARLRLSSISSRLEFRSEAEVTRPANSDRRLPSICIEHVPFYMSKPPLLSLACPSKFRPNYSTLSYPASPFSFGGFLRCLQCRQVAMKLDAQRMERRQIWCLQEDPGISAPKVLLFKRVIS